MDTTSTGRPAGKTGPIAAAVLAAIDTDLEYPPQSCGEGAAWCLLARVTGAHKGHGHAASVLADRLVEGRAA